MTSRAATDPFLPSAGEELGMPSVIMRDRHQFEVRQSYPLPDQNAHGRAYLMEVFLYLPRNMGVSAQTYKKEDFYTDNHMYLRLDAPGRTLFQLASLHDDRSPLALVHRTLPRLLDPRAPETEPLVSLVQLHAHELAEATISAFGACAVSARTDAGGHAPRFLELVQRLLSEAEGALVAIRQVRAEADAFGPLCHPGVQTALGFAEEFVSAVLDEQVARLSDAVRSSPSLHDGQGTAARVFLVLSRFAQEQARLRLEAGYALPYEEPREYFAYRLGLLKKNLQQALYLNTREAMGDNYLRNSAAMVAAGLAATWAFIAQMPMQMNTVSASTQVAVLGSAVGAYMLKDRIKEWTRDWLTRRLRIDDYSRRIVPDALARFGLEQTSGRARERMRFLKQSEVDPEVHRLRLMHRSVMGTSVELEEVLHYRRKLTLKALEGTRTSMGFGIREIMRFNISALTRRLDDPLDVVSYYDAPTGQFTKGSVPKVYHANLVLSVGAQHLPERWLVRSRLVLNQEGLLRVEPVATRKALMPRDRWR